MTLVNMRGTSVRPRAPPKAVPTSRPEYRDLLNRK
jgi:hypothetical protein